MVDTKALFGLMREIAWIAATRYVDGQEGDQELVEQVYYGMLHRCTKDVMDCALALLTDAEDAMAHVRWYEEEYGEPPYGPWVEEGALKEVNYHLSGKFDLPVS